MDNEKQEAKFVLYKCYDLATTIERICYKLCSNCQNDTICDNPCKTFDNLDDFLQKSLREGVYDNK